MATADTKKVGGSKGKEEVKPRIIKSTTDLQRLRLEKLMKNPEKPVVIPATPRAKSMPSAPDFVRNVMGSSAGAGSGEFHVYRHLRRKEYARQKFIQEKSEQEKLDEEYHNKLEANKRLAEERTAKKRALRLKKKKNAKNKKKKVEIEKSTSKDSDSESESENEKETEERAKDNDLPPEDFCVNVDDNIKPKPSINPDHNAENN